MVRLGLHSPSNDTNDTFARDLHNSVEILVFFKESCGQEFAPTAWDGETGYLMGVLFVGKVMEAGVAITSAKFYRGCQPATYMVL